MSSVVEKLTQNYLNVIDEHITFLDADCKIIYANDAGKKQFKDTKTSILGKDCGKYCKFKDYKRSDECPAVRARKTGKKQITEFESKDGSIYQVTVYPISENNEIVGFIEISTDITERKEAENVIKESEEKYKTIIDTNFDIYFEIDTNLVLTDFSKRSFDVTGFKPEEIIGRQAHLTAPKEVQQKYFELYSSIMKTEQSFTNLEIQFEHKNGQELILEVNASPHSDDKGEFLGYRGFGRDITERKKVEIALKESEEKFRTLVETMNDGLYIRNTENEIEFVNNAICEILGYKKEEVIGKSIFDFIPEDAVETVKQSLAKISKGQELQKYELPLLRKDGSIADCIIAPNSMINDSGNTIGTFAVITDITKRKQAETELKDREQMLMSIIENSPLGFVAFQGGEDNIIITNDALQNMLGYTNEELKEKAMLGVTHKEDITSSKEIHEEFLKRKKIPRSFEKRYIAKDGAVIPSRVVTWGTYDENGTLLHRFGLIEDITEQKKAQQALARSEEQYRTLVETMNEGISVIDVKSISTFTNQRLQEMLGYTEEELLGISISDFLIEESKKLFKEQMKERRKGIAEPYEMSFRRKDGGILAALLSPRPQYDDEGRYIGSFAVITDITELKKAEDIRRLAYQQIMNNIQEFANLIDGIRNPLSVIQGAVDLEIPNWKELITTQVNRIKLITDQIDSRWSESEEFRNTLVEQLQ